MKDHGFESIQEASTTSQELVIHDELKNLLPPLTDEEYAGLEASLLKDGCLSDLIAWGKIIVDGHNRYEICQKHGISYGVKQIELGSLDDAKLWVWEHQTNRRNLTDYHRGELALKLKSAFAAKAKERQRAAGGDKTKEALTATLPAPLEKKETRQELAERTGVGCRTFNKIEYIAEHADEKTKEKLRSGEKGTSINKEYNRLRNKTSGARPDEPDTAVANFKVDTAPNSIDEAEPYPPCPNKDKKYYPKTTLQYITHETPRPLLVNLFELFPKEYVEELFPMGMRMLLDNRGKEVVKKVMGELNEEFGPKKIR